MIAKDKLQALLIDDDPLTNVFNRELLSCNDAFNDVITINNGEDALNFVKNQLETTGSIPCLILVDVYMPKMNGFEFIEELYQLLFKHEKEEYTEVNILSSTNNEEDIVKFVQSRLATKFISKPFSKVKLEQLMKRLQTRCENETNSLS